MNRWWGYAHTEKRLDRSICNGSDDIQVESWISASWKFGVCMNWHLFDYKIYMEECERNMADALAQTAAILTPRRIEAFNYVFGQHMCANRLDLIFIADIEDVVN
ncbi:putative DNA helicase [Lupinus albus]|uniref:Putative DNA helicase n=1 Tax=Lupinus albus TaxID=3870 RepID=A0A6A4PE49_LUPAL|nr:putative DNA helicase [Lupinus albus]